MNGDILNRSSVFLNKSQDANQANAGNILKA
jgi:hypothetical protein